MAKTPKPAFRLKTKYLPGFVAKFKRANTGRKALMKTSIIVLVLVLTMVPAFILRDQVLAKGITNDTAWIKFVAPYANKGISWGQLSENGPAVVFVVQLLPFVIGILFLIFLETWWTVFPVALIMAGGLANVVDRGIADVLPNGSAVEYSVVDYLQFDGRSEKFNYPDACIFVGLGLAVLALFWYVLKSVFGPRAAVVPEAGEKNAEALE